MIGCGIKYAMCCKILFGKDNEEITIFCRFVRCETKEDMIEAAEVHKATSGLRTCRHYSFYEIGKEPVFEYETE